MSAKDRTTAYVCSNADGSEKLPLAIYRHCEKSAMLSFREPAGPILQQQDCRVYLADVSKLVKLRISTPHSLFHLQKRGFVGGQRWVTF